MKKTILLLGILVLALFLVASCKNQGGQAVRVMSQGEGGGSYPANLCGNGVINSREQCDGSNFGGIEGCQFFGFNGGVLNCYPRGNPRQCMIDTSACRNQTTPVCGNGVIDPGEECDGSEWGAITGCNNFGSIGGGWLSCYPPGSYTACYFDTSRCLW
ncbi:MAG: hypothetical protein V1743_02935 [Nanoarchaeota archaeon]